MLQKELKKITGFDAWYQNEQNKMRGDHQLKLLHNLRTDAIHIRSLLPRSTIAAGQFKHGRQKLVLTQIPLGPSRDSVDVIISMRNRFRDACLGSFGAIGEEFGIERFWSLPELDGADIVDFCTATWVKLVKIVSDAHGFIGLQSEAPSDWPDPSRRYRSMFESDVFPEIFRAWEYGPTERVAPRHEQLMLLAAPRDDAQVLHRIGPSSYIEGWLGEHSRYWSTGFASMLIETLDGERVHNNQGVFFRRSDARVTPLGSEESDQGLDEDDQEQGFVFP